MDGKMSSQQVDLAELDTHSQVQYSTGGISKMVPSDVLSAIRTEDSISR